MKDLKQFLLICFIYLTTGAAIDEPKLEIKAISADIMSTGIVNSSAIYYSIREGGELSLECLLTNLDSTQLDIDPMDVDNDIIWVNSQSEHIHGSFLERIRTDLKGDPYKRMLHFSPLEIADSGWYSCLEYNYDKGEAKRKKHILVKVIDPHIPNQPNVTLQSVSEDSMTWHIEENHEEVVRVSFNDSLNYIVSFTERHSTSKSTSTDADLVCDQQKNEENDYVEMRVLYFQKAPKNLYNIGHLKPCYEYEFTFVAKNEFGESEPIMLKASTTGTKKKSSQEEIKDNSSASLINSLPNFVLFTLIILIVPIMVPIIIIS